MNEYVKFMTEQVVIKFDQSWGERKGLRRRDEPPVFPNRWFGMIPFLFRISFKK